jgi:hypothetical protein
LNNHPLAGFTWYAHGLDVTFSDNSYYRPETWAWDFGDSSTATERNPLHAYDLPGEYHVCLTVSNEYDSDTYCRWVTVDSVTTGIKNPVSPLSVRLYPNPAKDKVHVELPAPLAISAEWVLYNQLVQPVRQAALAGLPPGLYFWQAKAGKQGLGSGKVVVK